MKVGAEIISDKDLIKHDFESIWDNKVDISSDVNTFNVEKFFSEIKFDNIESGYQVPLTI